MMATNNKFDAETHMALLSNSELAKFVENYNSTKTSVSAKNLIDQLRLRKDKNYERQIEKLLK